MKKIKIAIADQHPCIRFGLNSMLNENKDLKVIHLAENTKDLIELIEHAKKKPDIVIIDINLAKANKHQASKKIINLLPNCKIMYLSDTESKDFMEKLISKHAHGYISREYDTNLMYKSIQKVL